MKKILTAISLTTLIVSGTATAAGSADAKHASASAPSTTNYHSEFVKLDANKDGYLEKSEVRSNATLKKDFAKATKSGRMSESEFTAWEVKHRNKHTPSQT